MNQHESDQLNEQQQHEDQQQVANDQQDQMEGVETVDECQLLIAQPILWQQFVIVLVEGVFGLLFYRFSTNESDYGGEECVKLRNIAHLIGYSTLLICAIQMLIIIGFGLFNKKIEEQFIMTFYTMQILFGIFMIVLFGLLWHRYKLHESCGHLSDFTQIMLIIAVMSMILVPLILYLANLVQT